MTINYLNKSDLNKDRRCSRFRSIESHLYVEEATLPEHTISPSSRGGHSFKTSELTFMQDNLILPVGRRGHSSIDYLDLTGNAFFPEQFVRLIQLLFPTFCSVEFGYCHVGFIRFHHPFNWVLLFCGLLGCDLSLPLPYCIL